MGYDPTRDLEAFDDGFAPSTTGFQNLEAVADGVYDWTILTATFEQTAKSGDTIFVWELRCESTGQVIRHTYFFRSQEAVNRLGGDLGTLGFDTATWDKAHGKKFSTEIQAASRALPGMRFSGTKRTSVSKNDGKTYHNLNINSRLKDGSPGVAATAASAPAPAARQMADAIPF